MEWIFDHFQLVALVVFVIGSILKSLWDARVRQKSEYGGPAESDGEVIREIPLGEDKSYRKPTASTPPPLPQATVPRASRNPGYDAAVADEAAKALKHQQDLAERLRAIRETKATTSGGAAATRARVASKKSKKDARSVEMQPVSLSKRLRDPAEVRRAFVMREILDPPVGLR